ncbi:MAG: hypothetical protein L0227_08455 [Chloroflexi bacterium]|nr:hypothetical protein [Chloroflexota bacterium]
MKDFGQLLMAIGALLFLPSLADMEWVLSAWLGDLQAPIGLSALIVGAVVFGASKLIEFRNASPVAPPSTSAPGMASVGDPAGASDQDRPAG